MAEKLPYDRQAGVAWSALTFDAPRVLDTGRVRRTWTAWFALTHTDDGPICAESTVFLLDLLRDTAAEPARPYCALILAADARSRLARQARADEYLGSSPGDVAAAVPEAGWHFLAQQIARRAEQSVARRTVLVSALTQLGFYRLAIELAGDLGQGSGALGEHLRYETARAWRQADRSSPAAATILTRLAADGDDAPIRILACTQLISILLRDRRAGAVDQDWAAAGERLLPELDATQPWLRALITSRLWRAAAFQRLHDRDKGAAAKALGQAYDADDECYRLAADPLQRHCARENRRLLFDVTVKAGTSICTPEQVATAVDGLLALDGSEPSARFHVAALAARNQDTVGAAEEFDRAAVAGTMRGAAAAARAAQCWQAVGDSTAAARSWELLLDLDPAALSDTLVPAGEGSR